MIVAQVLLQQGCITTLLLSRMLLWLLSLHNSLLRLQMVSKQHLLLV